MKRGNQVITHLNLHAVFLLFFHNLFMGQNYNLSFLYLSWIFGFLNFTLMAITGQRIEEAFEEAQCPKALDARQTWWCICKSNLSACFPSVMLLCIVLLFICIMNFYLFIIVVIIIFGVGSQAFFWTSQIKGVPAIDPYLAKQVEVCSHIP